MADLENELVVQAVAGDQKALETLLCGVQKMVFNLSLRMLGLIPDAEDATQEILVKIMTHLSSFRSDSAFSTWVYRIAVNHLKDYKKSMFSEHPLSFEIYGEDIASGKEADMPDRSNGVDHALLEQELKLSCSNVMLQCLNAESRAIYILGTMFRVDSRVAAEILEITPEAYRQRLSRIRKKVGDFLSEYCGLSGTGMCACKRRIHFAIATHRLNPANLEFRSLETCKHSDIIACKDAMEELDASSMVFAQLPMYNAPEQAKAWLEHVMNSRTFQTVLTAQEEAK